MEPSSQPRRAVWYAPPIPFSAILLLCLAVASSRAQQAPAPTPDPEVVLHADTNLVLVDVVVTDKDGAIHGLHQPQFHITEDGKERTLLSVDEHTPEAAQSTSPLPPLTLPPHIYTNAPQFPPQAAVNILLLDGLNTPMKDQMRTRQQMLDYVATLPPGAPLAIFTLTSRLRLLQGFTSDPAILHAALKNPHNLPQGAVLGDSQLNSSPGLVVNGSSVFQDGLTIPGAVQLFRSDMAALQSNIRVRTTLEALRNVGRYLDGIPGRKNLIWFSGSFPVGLDPEKATSDAFQGMQDYTDELRKTSIVLNEARVAVYPVDARGLAILPSTDIEYRPAKNRNGGMTASIMSDNAAATSQLVADHAAMHQIAEDTGGKSYANTGDFKGAVANALAHGSSYYTLAFSPGNGSSGDTFHKLKVRVDGSSYTLAYRHGYFTDNHSQQASPLSNGLLAEATKRGAPPATQIIFQARVLPSDAPEFDGNTALRTAPPAGAMAASLKKPHRYVVDLRLDPASFAFTTDSNEKKLAKVELSLIAYDADGATLNSYSQGMALNLTPEQFVSVARSGLPLRALLDLPPGEDYLRVAIRDLTASRIGSLEVPLRVAGK